MAAIVVAIVAALATALVTAAARVFGPSARGAGRDGIGIGGYDARILELGARMAAQSRLLSSIRDVFAKVCKIRGI
jgi:hypothetical protein